MCFPRPQPRLSAPKSTTRVRFPAPYREASAPPARATPASAPRRMTSSENDRMQRYAGRHHCSNPLRQQPDINRCTWYLVPQATDHTATFGVSDQPRLVPETAMTLEIPPPHSMRPGRCLCWCHARRSASLLRRSGATSQPATRQAPRSSSRPMPSDQGCQCPRYGRRNHGVLTPVHCTRTRVRFRVSPAPSGIRPQHLNGSQP